MILCYISSGHAVLVCESSFNFRRLLMIEGLIILIVSLLGEFGLSWLYYEKMAKKDRYSPI